MSWWLEEQAKKLGVGVAETPDEDPRKEGGWSPEDGAGHIPKEERPTAEGESIPSSVKNQKQEGSVRVGHPAACDEWYTVAVETDAYRYEFGAPSRDEAVALMDEVMGDE